MSVKCPKCQAENPETKQFCGDCGTQLPPSRDTHPEVTETLQTPIKELTTGSTFAGRFQVIEELGKGGMGKVYKVLDTSINERIALKLLKPEIAADRETIERFSNELKFARKIRHKNVCQMFDLGKAEGTPYITMEYVAGEDLKSMIRMSKRLSIGTAVDIAKQICEGLAEAHALGVVHRDLKPSNIMIDKEGNARIMDFGIARSLRGKGITGAGVIIGTPEYMSPEQVEGKDVDQRTDIYSLGVILYEMVTGLVPFEGDTPFTVGVKHKSEMPKNPREVNPQIPEDLSVVILRCLEKDKNARYQTAAEVGTELEKIEKGIPTTERVVPERKTLTSREITVKFAPKKLIFPAAAIVVLIAAGLFFLLKPHTPGLDRKRVVVAPFENKTGDWITQGLTRLEGVAVSSVPDPDALKDIKNEKDKVRLIAKATRSGKVVTGAYYLEGETMRFAAQVHDALQGKLLNAVEPVSGAAKEPVKVIEALSQKVMGTLAVLFDARTSLFSIGQIPNYQAYQAFSEGRKAFIRGDFAKSIELYDQANQADPNFISPLLSMSAAYYNLDQYAQSEEVAHKIEASKERLTPSQIVRLEGYFAVLKGDQLGAYQAAKRFYELDPAALNAFGYGLRAIRINRPREAIQIFKTVDPGSPTMKDWLPYWNFYSFAYHMLGEHKKELAASRQ